MKSRALTLIASESKLRDSDIWQLRVSACVRCVTVGKLETKMDLGLCIQYKLSFLYFPFIFTLGSRDDGDMTMNLVDVDFDWHGGPEKGPGLARYAFGLRGKQGVLRLPRFWEKEVD